MWGSSRRESGNQQFLEICEAGAVARVHKSKSAHWRMTMPTYHCTTTSGLLNSEKKSLIAKEITRVHTAVTGAANLFAQVIFKEVAGGDHFVGGTISQSDRLFVHGFIRAGRSITDRQKLVTDIVDAVSAAGNLPRRLVWVYVTELPPRQMAEYGHILPEPGDEQAWLDKLPADDKAYMLSIGR